MLFLSQLGVADDRRRTVLAGIMAGSVDGDQLRVPVEDRDGDAFSVPSQEVEINNLVRDAATV